MRQKGFAIIGIILCIFIAMLIATYFGFCYYETDKANQELKKQIDANDKMIRECETTYTTDKNIYWKGSSAFVNETNTPLKKILNINDLIILRSENYD